MIRWSRCAGLCSLLLGCLGTVACDDNDDRTPKSHSFGGTDGGGTAGQADAGNDGEAASAATAGTDSGQAGTGATGGTFGTAGTAGTAGTGGSAEPTCATNCNDNNPCTDDACENDLCVHRDNAATCDDGNACTSDDVCSAGACKGTNNTAACDDKNACTSDDACSNGTCVGTNNTATCDDKNECTSNDVCSAGACKGTNNTNACDDLSTCTTGDQCWNGACRGNPNAALCPVCDVAGNLLQNCDFSQGEAHWPAGFFDGGAGTQMVTNERLIVDITNGTNNAYAVQPRQEPLSLKQGMKYKLRMVAGASVERDFVVSLTLATAPYTIFTPGDTKAGYTVHVTPQMKPTEFEFVVTEPDNNNVKLEIKLGGQAGNPSVVYLDDVYLAEVRCADADDCSDGNDCTTDTCEVATGICSTAVRNSGACTDDGNVCTNDVCVAGVCTHPNAEDDEPCTVDADNCTADVCKAGACTHAFDPDVCDCQIDEHCNDDETCTDDKCNAGTCEHTSNTAVCDDGNVCTSNDVCAAGSCGGTDISVACDTDVCTVQTACATGDQCAPATNVCFDCKAGGNLLTNCDFATNGDGWLAGFFNGGAGTQTVENGMLAVNITGAGNEVWQVQPRQAGVVLAASTTYVVRFNAYATVARPIIVTLTQDGGNFTSYSGPRTFNLKPEMQEFTFEFTMAAVVPGENVKFEFDLGGAAQNPTVPNTVYLDNLFIGPKP